MKDFYDRLVRPVLFAVDPEKTHNIAMTALCWASKAPGLTRAAMSAPVDRPVTLFGVKFRNRVGLAAGFDKNGVALPSWEAMGFGFIEIGTVTASAQRGNPKPRIFRLPEQRALINRLGFNNDGADVVAARLEKLRASGRWPQIPVGINIGKSRATPMEGAADDYVYSFRKLESYADYLVLNVSSPNTPGLRSLQMAGSLAELLGAIEKQNATRKPVLVKIAPDISMEELEAITETCETQGVAGVIATNTTVDHSPVRASENQEGGLSGAPLREKSTAIVRTIARSGRLPVIGCGGIMDASSAQEKFDAGAQLVQIYTGLIYRGPTLIREIAEL